MNPVITRRLFNAHVMAAMALPAFGSTRPERPARLIAGLALKTSVALERMRGFYHTALGMDVVSESEESITFGTASGWIRFEKVEDGKPAYHFAFNIPENQILLAHTWLDGRAEPIIPPDHLNDAGMPKAVVAFRHWNAHSRFFWDPAGNAVEFIARHGLDNGDDRPFSTRSILEISEIGLVVDAVPETANQVKKSLGLDAYIGAGEFFEPVGTPHGLVLLMKRGRKMAFGKGRQREVHPTIVNLERHGASEIIVEGYPYRFVTRAPKPDAR